MSKKKKKKQEDVNDIMDSIVEVDDDIKSESPDAEMTEPEVKTPSKKSSVNTLTMGEFLSTSREIKQRFNKYVIVGFEKHCKMARLADPAQPYRGTYDDWLKIFVEYAET